MSLTFPIDHSLFFVEKLFQHDLATFYLVQHNLINFYSSKTFHGNIYHSPYCEMIAGHDRFGRVTSMSRLYPLYPILSFLSNVGFAFSKFKLRRIWRIYTSYIFCKKLVLDLKPFFLLRELVESRCNFLSCQRSCSCCHFVFSLIYLLL